MSGVEIFGIAASALQIADLGAKVSVKLFGFARKVRGAADKIDLISKEIAATGALLQQLSQQLDKDSQVHLLRRELIESANKLVRECMKIFKNIDKAIDGNSGNKIILSLKQKIQYTYLESEIDALRANLESLKSSIGIMQNVLIYAEQLRNRERFPVLKEQQDLLQTLGEEKLANEQRYNTLMEAIKQRPDSLPILSPTPSSASAQLSTVHVPLGSRSQSLSLEDLHNSSEPSSPKSSKVSTYLNSHELREYTFLTGQILEEIRSERYALSRSMRLKVYFEVLDLHWQEWAPFRRYYSDDMLLRKLRQLPELLLHWQNKIKQGQGMFDAPDEPSSKTCGARVDRIADLRTKESRTGPTRRETERQAEAKARAMLDAQEREKKGKEEEKKGKEKLTYLPVPAPHLQGETISELKAKYALGVAKVKVRTPGTYTRLQRKRVSPQTLDSFGLDWESDEENPECMIVKHDLSPSRQEELYEHTRKGHSIEHSGSAPLVARRRHFRYSRLSEDEFGGGDDDDDEWDQSLCAMSGALPTPNIIVNPTRSRRSSSRHYRSRHYRSPQRHRQREDERMADDDHDEDEADLLPPPLAAAAGAASAPAPDSLDIDALVSQWTTLSPREIARGSEMARR